MVQNALLLKAIAVEAPSLVEAWAQAMVDSYRVILEIDPVLATPVLIAALFDPSVESVDDESRAALMRAVNALRGIEGATTRLRTAAPLSAESVAGCTRQIQRIASRCWIGS